MQPGRVLVATPFITIARQMSSHRASQGVIYADMLKQCGIDVTVNMTLDLYHEDFNEFDSLAVYHGNDWSGSVNLFGGLKSFPYVDNFLNFSKFRGPVISLVIDHPDYYGILKPKVDRAIAEGKEIDPRWTQVDWDNLLRMQTEAVTVDPNVLNVHRNVAVGDSHGICMYRPGWTINSVPFKTLHGALGAGLETFLPAGWEHGYEEFEFYFGNIDVRHHLARQPEPEDATRELVAEYFGQVDSICKRAGTMARIYELLPIEAEHRAIPKTGWYKGTPFFGSQSQRNGIRLIFKDEARKRQTERVKLFEWVEGLQDSWGHLDFKYMEKPQSIHLSRAFYPHWQGREWNVPRNVATLEEFFS
jgi:hypothetical protein